MRSFTDIRSYYFRQACALVDRDRAIYGGRGLDEFKPADFRILFKRATKRAREDYRAARTPWRP